MPEVVQEIERKHLLKSSQAIDLLKANGVVMEEHDILQAYIIVKKNYELRIRQIDNIFKRTIKHGNGLIRQEEELDIEKEEFNYLFKQHIGNYIKKRRYSFKIESFLCSIDVYEDDLDNLVIFESEFPTAQSAYSFLFPPNIEKHILKEVTNENKYKNKYIALFGNPKKLINNTSFDIVEASKNINNQEELNNYINSNISAFNAMRLIFYFFLKKIIEHKNNYINQGTVVDLHQFRTHIRKTRSLLKCVKDIFDDTITQTFIIDLKNIASFTNLKRDLDVFVQYLELSDDEEAEILLEEVENKQEDECAKIKNFLQLKKTEEILEQWEIAILENNGFYSALNSKKHIKNLAAKALISNFRKISKKLDNLNETSNLDDFHAVRIEFKKLRYLSEHFCILFKDCKLEETIALAKKMQDKFGILQDRDVQNKILHEFENYENIMSNIEKMQAIEILKENIKNDIYIYKMKILDKKNKLINRFRKKSKKLIPYSSFN